MISRIIFLFAFLSVSLFCGIEGPARAANPTPFIWKVLIHLTPNASLYSILPIRQGMATPPSRAELWHCSLPEKSIPVWLWKHCLAR